MGLFDFIFRRTKTPITQAAGRDGTAAFAGKLVTFEENPDLQGRNYYLTLSNMIANTVVVGAAVRYYQNLLAGTAWTVTPNEEAGADGEKAADLVRTGLLEANMPDSWSTVVKRASLFRMHGFSLHEWTMRKRAVDGALIFAEIAHRPQSTIEFWDVPDTGGSVRGVVQRPLLWSDYYYIQRGRLLYCVDNSLTDQPDGAGMLRNVVEHGRRLNRLEQLELFSYETDMRGIPVGRIPYQELVKFQIRNGLPDSWVSAQIKPVENLVRNHIKSPWQGITLDSAPYSTEGESPTISSVPQWALDLIKGDGAGLPEVSLAIQRINLEIARCLGMEFMMLGGDGKGSLALSRDKTSMFATVLESSLHELGEFTRRDLVWPLLTLNGLDPEKCAPQLNPDPIATERVETTVAALQGLALAGAILMPDDPAIDQIRSRLHLADQPKLSPEVLSGIRGNLAGRPAGKPSPGKPGAPNPKADAQGAVDPVDGSGGKNEPDAKPKTKKSTFHQPAGTRTSARTAYDLSRMDGLAYEDLLGIANRVTKRSDGFYAAKLSKDADDRDRVDDIGGPYPTLSLALARIDQHDRLSGRLEEP